MDDRFEEILLEAGAILAERFRQGDPAREKERFDLVTRQDRELARWESRL